MTDLSKDAVLTFVKGAAGIVSALGMYVSPENAEIIGMGFFTLYGVIQGFRAWAKKKFAAEVKPPVPEPGPVE